MLSVLRVALCSLFLLPCLGFCPIPDCFLRHTGDVSRYVARQYNEYYACCGQTGCLQVFPVAILQSLNAPEVLRTDASNHPGRPEPPKASPVRPKSHVGSWIQSVRILQPAVGTRPIDLGTGQEDSGVG
ncbi:hypothetical protein P885DRAFT_58236 [Corynascus similis CBS 632.67]